VRELRHGLRVLPDLVYNRAVTAAGATLRNGDPPVSSGMPSARPDERLVYLVAADARAATGDGLGLLDLWRLAWGQRWLIVGVTAAFVAFGVVYSLLAEHWFRADVTLSPVEQESLPAGLGQFAGLASMAGISIPSSGSAEAIATMRSRDFAAEFINERQLMPILFADKWDEQRSVWVEADAAKIPRLGDAVKYFRERVLTVNEDKQNGLVNVSVRWKDPVLAADWANDLVRRVNARLRQTAIDDSQRNIAFLREQLVDNSIVTLQQSVGSLLETELQKLMLAKGNEEFAFKVIDPATVPIVKYRPQRILITLLSGIVGGFIALAVALLRGKVAAR
jgi:uncharacterized protein involved in exopolysaccharide biosynthesis